MKQNKLLLEKIKKDIDKVQIVSFDIFDTLLLRPYIRPTDLFLHIEKAKNKPFFCQLRQDAEREARYKRPDAEDITFDEIYNEIDDNFKLLKQVELDFEYMVLTQNPELKQVYDYVREKKKKLIITSDMYLSPDFLSNVLKKNGFTKFDKIYVSGDVGKGKYTGNLYKHIINDLNVTNSKDILHIGDNKHSDYKKAKKLGIRAILYKQVSKQFLENNPRVSKFLNRNNDKLGASIIVATLAMRWQNKRCGSIDKETYWENLGYEYAGPIAYGYSRFVEKEAINNKLSTLLFVARDGYTLQKVFDTFSSNIKNLYVYAPRFLNLICRLDYDRNDIKQSQAIIDYYSSQSYEIKNAYAKINKHNAKVNHKFIQDNLSLFSPLVKEVSNNYKKYLNNLVNVNGVVGTVDTITGGFSSQRILQYSLNNHTHGLYWGVLKNKIQNNFEYSTFISNDTEVPNDRNVFTANWNFIEFLITSPEYPIKNITADGCPIYDPNPTKAEIKRAELYPDISKSAILFANDIKSKFLGYDIYLEGKVLIDWVNTFIDNPIHEDIRYMSEINFGIDSAHRDYVPLFIEKVSFSNFIKNPFKILKRLRRNIWKTFPQKVLLCLFKPISIKMRGLKKLQLAIFPIMSKQYFFAQLNFSEKCFYRFIIGNDKAK